MTTTTTTISFLLTTPHPVKTKKSPIIRIENNLFQTVKNKNNLPRLIKSLTEFNKKKQNFFNYYLLDDEDIEQLYTNDSKQTDDERLATFAKRAHACNRNLRPGAYKSDLLRYYIIYTRGGVWLDDKSTLRLPLEDPFFGLDIYDGFITCYKFNDYRTVETSFMAGSKYNRLHELLLTKCLENLENRFYGEETMEITGPTMASKVLEPYLSQTGATAGVFTCGGGEETAKNYLKLKTVNVVGHLRGKNDELIWKHKDINYDELIRCCFSREYYMRFWADGKVYCDDNTNHVNLFWNHVTKSQFVLAIFSLCIIMITILIIKLVYDGLPHFLKEVQSILLSSRPYVSTGIVSG